MVRTFIRALFSRDYNLDINAFKDYKELTDFIKSFDNSLTVSPNIIAQLKRRPLNKRRISMVTKESMGAFLDFIHVKFPMFDRKSFVDK